tara:strand:+ start:2267 stop:2848 length:582 start_codon:yes stop_codon:yes gene_type:complete
VNAFKPRKRKCKFCKTEYMAQRPMQNVCSGLCGLRLVDRQKAKAAEEKAKRERRESREAKQRLKTRADYAKEAQAAINRYVRLRDAHLGCISCDKPASWQGQWHCSHFRSVGAAPHLRFNLWNMNKSCSACNNFLSGNIAGYRPRLIEKIGQEKVDWLEGNHSVARHDIPYLKRMKSIFTKKCRAIERRRVAA